MIQTKALNALQTKISEHTDLLDEYSSEDSETSQKAILETFSNDSRTPLIDQVESNYQLYILTVKDKLQTSRVYALSAVGAFLLALAFLIFSALRGNATLVKQQETLKSSLELKDQGLGIAETLLIEQKAIRWR